MRTLNRLITTFDEVRHAKIARAIHGVEPETCTAEVSSGRSSCEEAARQDSAVHVSLSSDSLVKQRGTKAGPPSGTPKNHRSPSPRCLSEACSPLSVRSFRGAPSRRGGGRAEWGVYRPRRFPLSTPVRKNLKNVLALRHTGFRTCERQWAAAKRTRRSRRIVQLVINNLAQWDEPVVPHCGHIPPPFFMITFCRGNVASGSSLQHGLGSGFSSTICVLAGIEQPRSMPSLDFPVVLPMDGARGVSIPRANERGGDGGLGPRQTARRRT
jgi:hypothetical protein